LQSLPSVIQTAVRAEPKDLVGGRRNLTRIAGLREGLEETGIIAGAVTGASRNRGLQNGIPSVLKQHIGIKMQ